ncbi:MAG: hypothetical protein HY545_01430 [Candidatus Doudnabacteria bacterium]|nr:hypothetical protein [Candidatus Doudnabacteria bacterium]
MDIIKKIKPLKASFDKLSSVQKLGLLTILISLITLIVPHGVFAATKKEPSLLVFQIGDYKEFLTTAERQAQLDYQTKQLEASLRKKLLLSEKIKNYLNQYNSPLASYSSQLLELKNWKKIVALANAESSFCRRYPTSKANCWGVGGANLWDLGDNLSEGIKTMDKFLNNYPKNSPTKYSQMGFERMNGLYKQPAADHWVENTQSVYDYLTMLEKSV